MKLNKTLWLVYILSILSLAILWPFDTALAHTGGYGGWHMGPGMMGHWGFGWFGGISMIVFWILVLVVLIFFIKWLVQSGAREKTIGGNTDRALEILRERYAQGEIDKEEFETKKTDLAG